MRLFLLLMFVSVLAHGQSIQNTGNSNTVSHNLGGIWVDTTLKIPIRDTGDRYPSLGKLSRIQVLQDDSTFYFHNGAKWVRVASLAEVQGAIGDTSLYQLKSRLSQNLSDSDDTIYPSNGAVRRELAGINEEIAGKQDQISPINPITVPSSQNTRSDASAVVYRNGEYLIFYNHFYGASGDLSGASIALTRTLDFETFYDTAIIANTQWFGGRTIAIPQLYIDPRNGTLRMYFIANRELVLNDTAKTAVYMMELADGADPLTDWSDTIKVIENNRREVMASDRLLDVGMEMYGVSTGFLIMPYSWVAAGTGNSGSTLAYGGIYFSKNYGVTWDTVNVQMVNGNTIGAGSVFEPGMVYTTRGGWQYYFRTLNGEVRRVSMGYDTTFTAKGRTLTMMPAQNAQSTFKYFKPAQIFLGGVMRQLGRTTGRSRSYLDLALSDDFVSWSYFNMINVDSSSNELNEPTIYFADSLQQMIYIYTKTSAGVAYSRLECQKIPYSFLQFLKPITPSVVRKLMIIPGGLVGEDRNLLTVGSGTRNTDTIKSLSPTSTVDNTSWSPGFYSTITSNINNSIYKDYNINGNQLPTYFETGTRFGKGFSYKMKAEKDAITTTGVEPFAVASSWLKFPDAQSDSNSISINQAPANGAVRVNYDNNKLEARFGSNWKAATENYFYDLKLSNFATDSTYVDTSMRNRTISIFDNSTGRYLADTSFSMIATGGFQFTTKKVTSTDRFIVRTEERYIAGLVPTYYPLDTIGTPPIAVSLRKLRGSYNGYACRLTSLVDASTLDVGFTPQGTLDTFIINSWSGKDSCYVSRWYNQGSATYFNYYQSVTVPQGVRFRKVSGQVYLEFNGTSYLTTDVATTGSSLLWLSDGTKTNTISTVFMPKSVTTTTVYGLLGNNNGASNVRGIFLLYDNRAAQSSTNAIVMNVSNGTSGQPPINDKYNNTAAGNNLKTIVYNIYNPSLSPASARSKIYVNSSSVSQNNANSFTPSVQGPPSSLTLGTAGASSAARLIGNMYEVIIFDTELTDSKREALRNNQNAYYTVY
jgi:hypothetical protein